MTIMPAKCAVDHFVAKFGCLLDGLIGVLSFGFVCTNFEMGILYRQTKREMRKAGVSDEELQ